MLSLGEGGRKDPLLPLAGSEAFPRVAGVKSLCPGLEDAQLESHLCATVGHSSLSQCDERLIGHHQLLKPRLGVPGGS